MTNTNTLEGIACPKCYQEDDFQITATSVFDVTDDGTGDHQDVIWEDGSVIVCLACGHEGTIETFTVCSDTSCMAYHESGHHVQAPE